MTDTLKVSPKANSSDVNLATRHDPFDTTSIEHHLNGQQTHSDPEKDDRVDGYPLERSATNGNERARRPSAPPEDPPYHVFSARKKKVLVFIVSMAGLFSPLSSNIYYPALDDIADGLNISNQNILYTITIYMIVQGIAPSLWGPLSDIYGRRITYIATFITYLAANVGCALARNLSTLLTFRALQAAGSAATISIGAVICCSVSVMLWLMVVLGAGVIGDITHAKERGGYVGAFGGLRMAGQSIGPVLGGLITHILGYQSIFWFLVIFGTFALLLILTFLPETLRRIAGNGSTPLHGFHRPFITYIRSFTFSEKEGGRSQTRTPYPPAAPFTIKKILRPLRYLFEKDIFVTLFFGSITYTVWSMVTSSTTFIFIRHYHLSNLVLGAAFLPNGAGCVIGSLATGKMMDYNYKRCERLYCASQEDVSSREEGETASPSHHHSPFPYERARLRPIWFLAPLFLVSVALYGHSLALPTPAAPLVLQFFIAYASTGIFAINSALMIDLFPAGAAGATALNNLSRCLIGAAGVSLVQPLIQKVGERDAFLILAGVVGAVSPLVAVEWLWGEGWRREREEKQRGENGTGTEA